MNKKNKKSLSDNLRATPARQACPGTILCSRGWSIKHQILAVNHALDHRSCVINQA